MSNNNNHNTNNNPHNRFGTITFQDRIEETRKNITRGSKVRFIRDGKHVHEGVVVGLTTTFAQIYKHKPKNGDSSSGDVSPEYAGWYPLVCNGGGVVLA